MWVVVLSRKADDPVVVSGFVNLDAAVKWAVEHERRNKDTTAKIAFSRDQEVLLLERKNAHKCNDAFCKECDY